MPCSGLDTYSTLWHVPSAGVNEQLGSRPEQRLLVHNIVIIVDEVHARNGRNGIGRRVLVAALRVHTKMLTSPADRFAQTKKKKHFGE